MQKRVLVVLAAGVALAAAFVARGRAQEQIASTVTFSAPASISSYQPVSMFIKVASPIDPHPHITIIITANTGDPSQSMTFEYPNVNVPNFDTDAEVTTLIGQLNNANLSTRSLWRRVFDRLCLDFPTRFPGGCTVQ